jgi:hypothetical protein
MFPAGIYVNSSSEPESLSGFHGLFPGGTMLTLTTVVHSRREHPSGAIESIGTHCFIAVITILRQAEESRTETDPTCDSNQLQQRNTAIDHQSYDYE